MHFFVKFKVIRIYHYKMRYLDFTSFIFAELFIIFVYSNPVPTIFVLYCFISFFFPRKVIWVKFVLLVKYIQNVKP